MAGFPQAGDQDRRAEENPIYSNLQPSLHHQKTVVYRHHRHPSNASDASESSPFPDQLSLEPTQISPSLGPAFDEPSFVEEPLPMEGDFATMDLQSSPNLLDNSLPASAPASDSQNFRYNTLTWAKDHPYPDPQHTILATGGLRPKTSISDLTAMLESAPDSSNHPFQHHPAYQHPNQSDHNHNHNTNQLQHLDFDLDRTTCQNSIDQSNLSLSQSENQSAYPTFFNIPPLMSNNLPVPTITTTPLSSNPTSPQLRLNINHPAMPSGPSISLTSATPLTARPTEPLEKFFESVESLHPHSMTGLSNDSQTNRVSQSDDLFQSMISHPQQQGGSHDHQNCSTQQNSFLNPRPVRARQRSKSESMGKQQLIPNFNDTMQKLFFTNPLACPPSTQLPSTSTRWAPSLSNSSLNPAQSSDFWTTFQTQKNSSQPPQLPPSQSTTPDDSRGQLVQQFIDSSFLLGGLFDQLDHSNQSDLPVYDSTFLKPTAQLTHRRSHSVSHVHRRGRSEGRIGGGQLEAETMFNSFLPMPSTSSNVCLATSQSQMNNFDPMSPRPNLGLADSNWPSSFGSEFIERSYANTPQFAPQVHSPVPSDACFSTHSSRPRSYSHASSFESVETGGSGPSATVPLEYRSRTTAATKAASVKRRKAGVAARYICEMCGESFTRRYNLRGHQRAHKGEKPFACGYPGCTSRFARAHDQKRHYKLHLGVKDYSCPVCKKTFIRLDALQRHHKSDAGQACFQQLDQTRLDQGDDPGHSLGFLSAPTDDALPAYLNQPRPSVSSFSPADGSNPDPNHSAFYPQSSLASD